MIEPAQLRERLGYWDGSRVRGDGAGRVFLNWPSGNALSGHG